MRGRAPQLTRPVPPALNQLHMSGEGRGNGPRAVSAKGGADRLEAADQVEDFAPAVRAAGGRAEMGAAGEGAVGIDETAAGAGIEHGAGAVRGLRKTGAPGGAEGFYGEEGFGVGEPGSRAGVAELAALGPADAIAFDRPGGEIGVNLAHCGDGEGGAVIAGGFGGGHLDGASWRRGV